MSTIHLFHNSTSNESLFMKNKSLFVGIGIGMLFGVGMVIGTVIGMKSNEQVNSYEIDGMLLRAAASDSSENFSMATGSVSDQAEGAFFLDTLTGDLQCIVPYARTGGFGGHFKTNVFNDLQVQRTKKPRLLMVTGVSQFIGSNRPGNCLVYIVDATTGNFAAYAVPWNRQLESTGRPQSGALVALKVGQARNITLGQ